MTTVVVVVVVMVMVSAETGAFYSSSFEAAWRRREPVNPLCTARRCVCVCVCCPLFASPLLFCGCCSSLAPGTALCSLCLQEVAVRLSHSLSLSCNAPLAPVMSTPEDSRLTGTPSQCASPTQARRSVGKVEFKLIPSPEPPAVSGSGASKPRHEWDPGCVPATSSLLVRSSLTPDYTSLISENAGGEPQPPRYQFGEGAALGAPKTTHSPPTSGQSLDYNLGTSISVSSGVGTLSGGSPNALVFTSAMPPLSVAANAMSSAIVDAFPFSPMETDEDRDQAQRRSGPVGGRGRVANQHPLCMVTGAQATFGDSAPQTILGAEREEVFFDESGGGEAEEVPIRVEEEEEAAAAAAEGREAAAGGQGGDKARRRSVKRMSTSSPGGLRASSPSPPRGVPRSSSTVGGAGEGGGEGERRPSSVSGKQPGSRSPSVTTTLRPASGGSGGGSQGKSTGSAHQSSSPAEDARSSSSPSRARPGGANRVGSGGAGRPGGSPGGARGGAASRRGGRQAPGAGGRRASGGLSITEKALKKINYTAFSGNSLKPKARRAKMLAEFSAAHQFGAAEISAEYQAEADAFFQQLVESSFELHRQELLRLIDYIHMLRKDCKEKLEFAASTCNYTLDGVEDLLAKLHDCGLELSNKTQVLSFLDQPSHAAVSHGTANQPLEGSGLVSPARRRLSVAVDDRDEEGNIRGKGHVMAEARNADAVWVENEPHPRSRTITQEEIDKATVVKTFFSGSLEKLRQEAVELSLPPSISEMEPQNLENLLRLKEEESARKAERAAEALALKSKLEELTVATAEMMRRLQEQDAQQRSSIAGLQRALDESCTRQKVADDVLSGCLNQGNQEATFSFAHVKELEAQLRTRMDAIEAKLHGALDELIRESAVVCVENGAYSGAAAVRKYNKENCLTTFESRVERTAVEQADVLRDAQQIMLRLWQSEAYLPGREEKRTLLHRSFPETYERILQECDRDTLIRLLHHMSLQSKEATRCLMSALQEHEKFLLSNTAEAVALKEQEKCRVAVTALLSKMYEEGDLHDQPFLRMTPDGHLTSEASGDGEQGEGNGGTKRAKASLSEVVTNMVRKYNEMMGFEEHLARALVRQREELALELNLKWRPAFFDAEVPVPTAPRGSRGTAAGPEGKTAAAAAAAHPSLPDIVRAASQTAVQEEAATPSSPESVSIGQAVAFLQRSNPSLITRVNGGREPAALTAVAASNTITVVGEGRWGGRMPARASTSTEAHAHGAAKDYASLNPPAEPLKGQPAPGLPLRKKLVRHVVASYSSTVEQLTGAAADRGGGGGGGAADAGGVDKDIVLPVPPPRAKRAFDNNDLPFLQRQRQVLEPLLGKKPSVSYESEEAGDPSQSRLTATI